MRDSIARPQVSAFATAVAAGLAAGSGLLGPAATSARPVAPARLACTGHWKIVPSPDVAADTYNALQGVAVVSANNAWAVGVTTDSTPVTNTLTEHWNGHKWRIVPSPSIAGASQSYLLAVTAVPHTNQLWATGYSVTGGVQSTLIEHWNGAKWKVVPSPNVGTVGNSLAAVVALSATNAWATGASSNGPSASAALIEHWNGKKWSVASSPSVSGHVNLVGLTAVPGTKNLWAAGGSGSSTLAEHLSGGTWSVVSSPGGSTFSGISARAAKDVWGVGQSGPVGTLAEHWNGTAWKIVTSPSPGSGVDGLNSVAVVPGKKTAWAVGYEGSSVTTFQTLVERWNGTSWRAVTSPNPSTHQDFLRGVATLGSQAWAVGSSTTLAGVTSTLVEHYC